MKRFVIADTHFGHENIIKYCNRPFFNAIEMDEYIIQKWNSVVGKNDVVWFLGDFALTSKERTIEIGQKLQGNKRMVLGNHDHFSEQVYKDAGFNFVSKWPVLIDDCIVLSHAPIKMASENAPFFNIFGHVHDNLEYPSLSKTGACVSIERLGYLPIEIEEVLARREKICENNSL